MAERVTFRSSTGPILAGIIDVPDGPARGWSVFRIIGIEVKPGATLHKHDSAGLRHLQDRLGDRFVAEFVLHTGQHSLPFGDRLRAVPIDTLWRAAPQQPTTT